MPDENAFRDRLLVLEKNRTADLIFKTLIGLGFALIASVFVLHFPLGVLGLHLSIIAGLLRWGTLRQNAYAKPHDRAVEASPGGVSADGVLIPRARIADGWYQPRATVKTWRRWRPAGSTVQLVDRKKRIVFEAEMASEEKAVAFLRALGLDASQKRAEFRASSPILATQPRSFGLGLAIAALTMGWFLVSPAVHFAFPIPFLLVVPLVVIASIPGKIVVGVDGILEKWLWWKRFIPMSRIATVHPDAATRIALALTSGKVHTLYTASSKHQGIGHQQHRDVILARVREAQRAHAALGPGADVAALVARGTRSTEEWTKDLAALGENDTGYRRAAIREEDLWRVVEDPRATADARAGAARLLRKSLDDSGKARVRVAAEATASPKLRIALEAATGNDDEAADEALAQLGAETSA